MGMARGLWNSGISREPVREYCRPREREQVVAADKP
jgi:hypothetical protein